MSTKTTGRLGEDIAVRFLCGKGYEILERNYEKKWTGAAKGELDIIAKKNSTITFVEVKTTTIGEKDYGFPAEGKVDSLKQRKLKMLAQVWLRERKIPFDRPWQIDALAVMLHGNEKKATIRHLENITSA